MQETIFYLRISIRTLEGRVGKGKIYIGNDQSVVQELFNSFSGNKKAAEESMLLLELMETVNGQPACRQSLSCTLEELCENCKTSFKHLFLTLNISPPH